MRKTLAIVLLILGFGVAAMADSVDTTGFANSNIFYWGNPNTATYGQTITVGSNSVLNDFSFFLQGGQATAFRGYVMQWNGTSATGSVLWSSGDQLYTPPASGWQQETMNTGNLALNVGGQYVLFLSTSQVYNGSQNSMVTWQSVAGNPYSGGLFVYNNNGGNFGALTSTGWAQNYQGYGDDLSFKADFSSPTPEPGSLVLMGSGLLGLAGVARRRLIK